MAAGYEDKGYFRRKFPRRLLVRSVGVLAGSGYQVYRSSEIGEGGMSITGTIALPVEKDVVVTFQIPGGDFVSFRATVKSCRPENQRFLHGLSFGPILFSHKRQIRAFVSARVEEHAPVF